MFLVSHSVPWSIYSVSWSIHSIPWSIHSIPWSTNSIPWSIHSIPWSIHSIPWSIHSVPWSIHSVPWSIHTVPWSSLLIFLPSFFTQTTCFLFFWGIAFFGFLKGIGCQRFCPVNQEALIYTYHPFFLQKINIHWLWQLDLWVQSNISLYNHTISD